MADTFSFDIQANSSDAEEALKQLKQGLDVGKESAETLSHALDGDLSGTFKSLGELGKTLGLTLDLAFTPLEVLSFVQAVVEAADKLSTFISDTFIYTDAQKQQDAALKATNKELGVTANRIKEVDRATQLAAATTAQAKEQLKLKFELEDLGGDPAKIQAQIEQTVAAIATAKKDAQEKADKARTDSAMSDPQAGVAEAAEILDKSQSVISDLENQVNLLSEKLKLAQAYTNQTALAIQKDLAQAAAQTAQADAQTAQAAKAKHDADAQAAKSALQKSIQINIAKLESDKKTADAEIQQQTEAIRALATAHQISAEDELALNKSLIDKKFAQDEAALQAKIEQLKRDPTTNAAQIIAAQGEIATLTAQHYTELGKLNAAYNQEVDRNEKEAVNKAAQNLRAMTALYRANSADLTKAADKELQNQIEDAKQALQRKVQLIEQEFEEGKVNKQQEIDLVAKATQAELAQEVLFHEKRKALWAGDLVKVKEIEGQIAKAQQQSASVGTKAVTNGLKAQEQQYKQVFSQIGSAITSNTLDVLKGTETVAQGFQKMYQSLISGLVNYIAQKAEKKAEEWAIDKIFHTHSLAAATGAATGKAMTGAFASVMSALPFPANVATAPGVAAAAGATATGMGSAALALVDSSAGGDWKVDADRLNFVHKNETILPAGIAGKLRDMVEGGARGGSGTTVVVNHSVNAVDASSFQGHIRRHSNMIANEVTRALKRKGVNA